MKLRLVDHFYGAGIAICSAIVGLNSIDNLAAKHLVSNDAAFTLGLIFAGAGGFVLYRICAAGSAAFAQSKTNILHGDKFDFRT